MPFDVRGVYFMSPRVTLQAPALCVAALVCPGLLSHSEDAKNERNCSPFEAGLILTGEHFCRVVTQLIERELKSQYFPSGDCIPESTHPTHNCLCGWVRLSTPKCNGLTRRVLQDIIQVLYVPLYALYERRCFCFLRRTREHLPSGAHAKLLR